MALQKLEQEQKAKKVKPEKPKPIVEKEEPVPNWTINEAMTFKKDLS